MKWLLGFVLVASFVFAQSFELAKEAYTNATLDLEQMRREGFAVAMVEDRLAVMNESLGGRDAARLFETALLLNRSADGKAKAQEYFRMIDEAKAKGLKPGQDFKFVVSEARAISSLKEQAFDAKDALRGLDVAIKNSGVGNDSRVKAAYEKARVAFGSGRYGEVAPLVAEAQLLVENIEVERARERAFLGIARRNVTSYVREHAKEVGIALVVLVILCVWGFFEARHMHAKKMQAWTKRALVAASEGLRTAQKKYYAGELGRATYQGRMVQFHEKERDLKARLAVWNNRVEQSRKRSLLGRFKWS